MLSVAIVMKGADVPSEIWQMRYQHFGMWDEAQVALDSLGDDFKILIRAERGDNSSKVCLMCFAMEQVLHFYLDFAL